MAMCRDEAFRAEAGKLGIDMSPISGDAIPQLLARMVVTPADVISRYKGLGAERK
jgi:hypothetical protein